MNQTLWDGYVDEEAGHMGKIKGLQREDTVARAQKNPAGAAQAAGFAGFGDLKNPAQILSEPVDGYKMHFPTRMRQEVLSNVDALAPSWTDLMMWAVLIGEPKMAELLWSKTVQPLRSAVLASCMCRRLSKLPHLLPDAESLLEQSERFEQAARPLVLLHDEALLTYARVVAQLSINLLDAIPDGKVAMPLLLYIPCCTASDGAELMWQDSVTHPLNSHIGIVQVTQN